MTTKHWLMKTEPESFSIADLARVRVEPWTGVRNFMARNHMRAMAVGDGVLFYHSSCDPPGVAGLARVVRTRVIDATQFDPNSPYYDARSKRDAAEPRWDCVEVEYVETFPHFVTLAQLRETPALADMLVLKRGMRLSVQPVTPAEYKKIAALGAKPAASAKPATPAKPAPAAKPRRKARS